MVSTKKGQYEKVTFIVNKHSPEIRREGGRREVVRLKPREVGYKNWDDSLTLSFCGPSPAVQRIRIEPDTTATTVFLCGNSTVVDQEMNPGLPGGR